MLLTKLHIPAVGNNIVNRTCLYEKLNIGLSRKLILISAPAGFGKTTVVSDWINQNKIPTAWFSIDNGDNDPVNFFSYIITGIQSFHKGFGESALRLLNSPDRPSDESIANLLINEILNIDKNVLLVLDDFHLISSSEILKLTAYIIEHIPGNIHIVILTRSDPALPYARLRSQHQLMELRSSDLSFSANDISILFNKKLKLGISIEDAFFLESKTEGWIAGLQLTALSMHGRKDISAFIHDLKGDNRYIMDYLMEEVLKIQSDDFKDFLVQTSVLEQMSAPLCNAVLNRNDSQKVLETLEKNNMFVIPLDDERIWYRYHHLFADLLKQRLQLRNKEVIIELHNKACNWFEQHKMFDFAIRHAIAIQNNERSIQLIGDVVEEMWERGQHAAILNYGSILPEELIKKNANFCLYYAWVLIISGQVQKAAIFLNDAETIFNSNYDIKNLNNSNPDKKNLWGKITVASAYLHSQLNNPAKTIEYFKIALDNLGTEESSWLGWGWYAFGMAQFSLGDLLQSINAFNEAFKFGKQSRNIHLISTVAQRLSDCEQQLGHYRSAYEKCSEFLTYMTDNGYSSIINSDWSYAGLHVTIGSTLYMWGNGDQAYESVQIAYRMYKESKDIMLGISVLILNSMVLSARGEDKDSELMILEAEKLCENNQLLPYLYNILQSLKLMFFLNRKQEEKATAIVNKLNLSPTDKIDHLNEAVYMAYVHHLLAQGQFKDAGNILSQLHDIVNAGKRVERLIVVKITYAIYYKLTGDFDKACQNLIEALELCAPENLVMFFIHNIDDIEDILTVIFKKPAYIEKIPPQFIENIKIAIEKHRKVVKNIRLELLSVREIEMMKHIAGNMSNQEIADKLFISLNTVKTHLKNIFLKLEVDCRSKAVSKVKEMGLI
jgi:LuxR family transcriptional regulator, maltose regulon positive regulatory protein